MKRLYIVFISLGVLLSCSGGGGDDPVAPEENKSPTAPVQVYPLNNTLCLSEKVNFEWNSSTDPESDRVTYIMEVSESSTFSTFVFNGSINATSRELILPKGEVYYWRVKALDSKNAESGYSTASQFLTEGEGVTNHLPFSPGLVAPENNTEIDGSSTTLSWTASDADNDDLTYDVYLGTNSNPTNKVSDNQTETTYTASNLTAATTYYFKIVVKDDKGGVTIGQIWSFKTK